MITVKLNARVTAVLGEETVHFRTEDMRKRTIVFDEAEAEYPAQVAIDWWGDKCDLVQNIRKGDVVVVEFKIQSRPGKNGKPFTSLVGRDIALAKQEETEEAPQDAEAAPFADTFSDGEVAPF